MFRITRRHSLDHAPAFPSPTFRFPDGTAMPIYAEETESAETQERPTRDEPSAPRTEAS